jgi:hypothetical protein
MSCVRLIIFFIIPCIEGNIFLIGIIIFTQMYKVLRIITNPNMYWCKMCTKKGGGDEKLQTTKQN